MQAIEVNYDQLTDWESICETGRLAAANMDEGRWLIGDLSLLVQTEYGEDRIGQFAVQINVDKARVQEYRTVCQFWQKSVRAEILHECPLISYTHMRMAMKLEDLSVATEFVEQCNANGWTVEQARLELNNRLGKPSPPGKVMDMEMDLTMVDFETGLVYFHSPMTPPQELKVGTTYRLVLYEVPEEDNASR